MITNGTKIFWTNFRKLIKILQKMKKHILKMNIK